MNKTAQSIKNSKKQVQSQPIKSPSLKNQKSFYRIILSSIVVLLLVVGVYFIVNQQNKSVRSKQNTYTTSTSTSNPQIGFKARYFEVTENIIGTATYPLELTQMQDSSLMPISCTDLYSGFGRDYTSYDEKTQKRKPLSDTSIINYIQTLNNSYKNQTVSEIYSCSTQEGKTIVVYSMGPCGGGCLGIPYVGLVNGAEIDEVAKISDNTAYFGCRQPLQLTKDNIFYFRCGGGDGPGSSDTIYKLSLNNYTLSKVKHCNAGVDQKGNQYSKCE